MRLSLLIIGIVFFSVGLLNAAPIDVNLLGKISLDAKPRQVVTTADGQRIYILTDAGKVLLYSSDGQPQGSFEVGPDVTGITPQGANRLILQMHDRRQLTIVALEPIVTIATEGAPVRGNPAAPVTIVVFDDFQCPYCARAVPLLKRVLAAYPDQVKLVFKNFPLSMHRYAHAAATAALAAQKQGKFWELHDLLYANFNRLSPQKIRELAEQAGLDMARFDKDVKDPELQQRISADREEGLRVGVRGTPSIFIDGRLLAQRNMAGFSRSIEAELEKKAPTKPGKQ